MKFFKIIFTFASLILSNVTIASVVVTHFNKITHDWDNQTINGISTIISMKTAGKYAWVAGEDGKVAFYNGDTWSDAINVANQNLILRINPGFPVTGAKPTAWIEGMTADKSYFVTYFDGRTMKTYQPNAGTAYTAGGNAWFYDMNDHFVMASANNPMDPVIDLSTTKAHLEIANNYDFARTYVAYNDDNPTLLTILGDKEGGIFDNKYTHIQVIKYDAQGNESVIATLPDKSGFNNPMNVYAYNNNLLIGDESTGTNFRYSEDNGKTWIEHSNFISPFGFAGRVACGFKNEKFKPSTLACEDAKDPNAEPQQFDINNYVDYKHTTFFVTTPTGAWLESVFDDKHYIIYYDVITQEKTDTSIPSDVTSVIDLRALKDKHLVFCALDTKNTLSAYYFDGTKWITTPLNNNKSTCHFTAGGDGKQIYIDDDNVWLYYDYPADSTFNN